MTPSIARPIVPRGSRVLKPSPLSGRDQFRGERSSAQEASSVDSTVIIHTKLIDAKSRNRLSRLAGASSKPFRVWFPPQSPVRIEYSRELLRLLLPRQDEEYATGVLYGTRGAGAVRVSSAKPRIGLEAVGIFAARWRGEVFLTEPDILRLEALDDLNNVNNMNNVDSEVDSSEAIALVIAGGQGGFFVRSPDGSMQTLQSYQEFPVRAPSLEATRATKLMKLVQQLKFMERLKFLKRLKFLRQLKFVKQPKIVTQGMRAKHVEPVQQAPRAPYMKQWLPLAIAAAAVIFLSGRILPPPYFSRPAPFTVQEMDGQLRIALSPSALSPGARLQIVDGQERRSIAIAPSLTSVVYAPLTHDVHITLVR